MSEFQIYWCVTMIVTAVCLIGLGVAIVGRPAGVFIDDRRKMSLSRLQLVLWSWLIISAFLALALSIHTMDIVIPEQVWALLGISVGSAAGSVIVKGTKINQEPSTRARTVANRRGLLEVNEQPKDARWTDLFKAEEISDHQYIDIAKVQMFFFTLAAVIGYGMLIWNKDEMLSAGRFPEISTSIVALLGISHTGYLTVKAAPKTETA